MVPALVCIKWFDCHLPGAVVSQGTSRPNTENCSGFPPPTRQSASIEAELLDLTSIYSELYNLRRDVRKPVFGVSDQVRHKPGCTATEDG